MEILPLGYILCLCWILLTLVPCSMGTKQEEEPPSEYLRGDHVCMNYTTKQVSYKETYIVKRVNIKKCTLWNKIKGKCFGKFYPRYITLTGYRMVNKTKNISEPSCCEGFKEFNGTCIANSSGSDSESALTLGEELYMMMMVGLPVTGVILVCGITLCLVVLGITMYKRKSTRQSNLKSKNQVNILDNPIYNIPEERPYEKLRLVGNPQHTDTYDSLRLYEDVH